MLAQIVLRMQPATESAAHPAFGPLRVPIASTAANPGAHLKSALAMSATITGASRNTI